MNRLNIIKIKKGKTLIWRAVVAFVIGWIPFHTALSQEKPQSPNFIFIFVDDLGWTSTSVLMDDRVASSKSDFYQTPNLERLAQAGLRFSRGYAPAAICSPSRRSIQFGQTPARQGDQRFADDYHPAKADRMTIPKLLKSINPDYRTAHYGKWDLRADIYPEDLGYDESDGDTGNSNGNMNSTSVTKWTEYYITKDPKKISSLTGRATNFMQRQVQAGRPFYLQVSHYATHVDIQANEKTLDKYWKKDPGPIHGNPGFAAMTEDLDNGIGKIIDEVYRLGIENHTYIIFMADNGGVELIPQTNLKMIPPSDYGRVRRNFPLRGGKWTLYEGGIRVPVIVAGPGIAPGTVTAFPIVGWDLLPTLADLAGFDAPLSDDLDGQSFAPLLEGSGSGDLDKDRPMIFHRYHGSYAHSAVIKGKFKLVKHWPSGLIELFDLEDDIGETENLADSHQDQVKELYDLLVNYLRKVDSEVVELYNP